MLTTLLLCFCELTISFIKKTPFKILYLPFPSLAKAVIQYLFSPLNCLFQKQELQTKLLKKYLWMSKRMVVKKNVDSGSGSP